MAHARNFKDLTGQKMHRLTFLEYVGKNENRNAIWKVRCDCGTEFNVLAFNVTHGTTRSCRESEKRTTETDTNFNFSIL